MNGRQTRMAAAAAARRSRARRAADEGFALAILTLGLTALLLGFIWALPPAPAERLEARCTTDESCAQLDDGNGDPEPLHFNVVTPELEPVEVRP